MFRKMLSVALMCVVFSAVASADVSPGEKAPEFELFGVDYKYHSLAQYAGSEAIVVVFTCNHCPVAKAYEDELIELGREYQPKGIQFLAVNPNPADLVPADGFPQMKKRAEEKDYPFPYLYDETQNAARAYGAEVTPHIFVVQYQEAGGEQVPQVVYEGAVNNRHKDPQYLSNALDSILADEEIEKKKTAQFGCSVKYRKK